MCKPIRVEGDRQAGLDVIQDQLFQALGDERHECNWSIDIEAGNGCFFGGYRDNSC